MTSEQTILEKYHLVGRIKGNELLLRQLDATRFIQDCRAMGLTILGMDFYREEGSHVVEILSSADYSALRGEPDAVELTAKEAQALIEAGLPDDAVWVSFVVQ